MIYATFAELRAGYIPAASDDDEGALGAMLERASRAIDTRTRRPRDAFAPSPPDVTDQLIYGAGSPVLITPDYIGGTVESVVAGVEGTMPPGWAEYRRRDAAEGVMRVGLHTATAAGLLTSRVPWQSGAPFTVRARWGFAETPAEIVEATLKLVRHWWREGQGEVTGTVGDLAAARPVRPRGFPADVDDLIKPYILADVIADDESGVVEVGALMDSDHTVTRAPHSFGFEEDQS